MGGRGSSSGSVRIGGIKPIGRLKDFKINNIVGSQKQKYANESYEKEWKNQYVLDKLPEHAVRTNRYRWSYDKHWVFKMYRYGRLFHTNTKPIYFWYKSKL